MSMTIAFALASAVLQVPASEVQVVQEGGAYVMRNLIDNNPLYTFDKDEVGTSHCNDACAVTWRPLWASESAVPIGKWTLIRRADGSRQWAYEGQPVYSFARDPEPVATARGTGMWHLLPTSPAP